VILAVAALVVLAGGGLVVHFLRQTGSVPAEAPKPKAEVAMAAPEAPPPTAAPTAAPPPSPAPPTAPVGQEFRALLKVEPADAELHVDGALHTERPAILTGVPGKTFKVEGRREGYISQAKDILIGTEDKRMTLQLEALAAKPAAEPPDAPAPSDNARTVAGGTLSVAVLPFAKVIVDGKPVGSTPIRALSLRPGTHRVELINDALGKHETMTKRIESGRKQSIKLEWN
jgi:serine/threonine-protein kinase